MSSAAKVLFLVPYPLNTAPSQRFRVELFLPELKKAGINFRIYPFMDYQTWLVLYRNTSFFLKVFGLVKGIFKRWMSVIFVSPFYDYVFIHREAAPVGPPIFEWWLTKIYGKKIIYDFDDAIWIPNTSSANNLVRWFKAFWKVKYICKWAYKVVAGNDYLCHYARQYNKNVIHIPTSVDVVSHHNKIKLDQNAKVALGWTGSHSTLKYLDMMVPIINELQKEIQFDFIVISDQKPALNLRHWQFIPWKVETETTDLLKMHIGIMPLSNDAWSEGKCGFKLVQYFASGIPAVASPVGVNKRIVEAGKNGFLCASDEEWKTALRTLLTNADLRKEMGTKGRKKVESEFSLQSQLQKFLTLFA
jgi:glycosyltransferase involved in cell wall biosynthesis